MRMSYYIDESGNTGDLSNYDSSLRFGDQPLFSLAAVGIQETAPLEEALRKIRQKHRVQMSELKAAALWDKPGFLLDVARLISDLNLPYFIEIVEKKFFLSMNMVTFQLLRPFPGSPEGPMTSHVRNEIAEHIYRHAPDEVFDAFAVACITPSDTTLRAEFTVLSNFAEGAPYEGGRAEALRKSVAFAFDEYESESLHKEDAHRSFLPSPDVSKRGKLIWLLPNIASLINVYARINLFENGNVSDIDLIHDEQAHFEEILQANKSIAESLGLRAANLHTPHSNFEFLDSAPLRFARSIDSLGLQVADLVTGFCMRYARTFLEDSRTLATDARECFRLLNNGSRPDEGMGINYVMTTRQARALMGFPSDVGRA